MILPELDTIKTIIEKSNNKLNSAINDLKEKFYDDCASRCYYAVFHIITALLLTKGLTYSSHNQALGAFNKEFIHKKIFPVNFSKKIETLFKLRHSADYDVKKYIEKQQAEQSISEAKIIIENCKSHLSKIYNIDNNFWQ